MKKIIGSIKRDNKSVEEQLSIKQITLEDIKEQQDKILEMVSMERFQERLCSMIQEEIHTAVLKHSEIAQRKINAKLESNIANIQFVIVNRVIEEVTNHIERRIEVRLKQLERQIEDLEKREKTINTDAL